MTSDKAETSAPAPTKADYERLAAFRYALNRFLAFSGDAAEAAGMTPQQHQALLAIKGFPGREDVTVGELAERLGLRHHSAVGLIDRLVARGFVQRRTSEADRRSVLIALTPEAETLLAGLSRTHRQELKRLSPTLMRLLGDFNTD